MHFECIGLDDGLLKNISLVHLRDVSDYLKFGSKKIKDENEMMMMMETDEESNSAVKKAKNKKILYNKEFGNIYTDVFVEEVHLIYEPLQNFQNHVKSLLEQWNDHAVLMHLLKLSEKILSLPVTTPLMKMLTGLELLLRKSQEWEEVASSTVSLQQQTSQLSPLVARWRKLELQSWKQLLYSKQLQYKNESAKFWLRLYPIIMSNSSDDVFDM